MLVSLIPTAVAGPTTGLRLEGELSRPLRQPREPSETWQPGVAQPLAQILAEEGLTYQAVQDLCPPQARVLARTVRDIALGARRGEDRSRRRILDALNRYSQKRKEYQWQDLYRESPHYQPRRSGSAPQSDR